MRKDQDALVKTFFPEPIFEQKKYSIEVAVSTEIFIYTVSNACPSFQISDHIG